MGITCLAALHRPCHHIHFVLPAGGCIQTFYPGSAVCALHASLRDFPPDILKRAEYPRFYQRTSSKASAFSREKTLRNTGPDGVRLKSHTSPGMLFLQCVLRADEQVVADGGYVAEPVRAACAWPGVRRVPCIPRPPPCCLPDNTIYTLMVPGLPVSGYRPLATP
jgi:hypothetical protein